MSWSIFYRDIHVEKGIVAIWAGWNKEESGLMVHLNLFCYIFDENESEEFQNCLEKVDALAKPESDQALPKFNDDGYNEFKKASQENWNTQ